MGESNIGGGENNAGGQSNTGGKSHWREENEGAGSSSVSFYEGGNLSPKDLPSCIIG